MRHSLPDAGSIDLRKVLPESRFFGANQIRVASCCGDSRHCRPGDLFAALAGLNGDGHDHASDAIARGAAAVLSERYLPLGVPSCVVDDSRAAYGRVCHALAGDPSGDMNVVGVTGTYGKTITTLLVTAILEAAGHDVGIVSSLGFCDGDAVNTKVSPHPTAPEVVRWLSAMRDQMCTHAVVEAPSQGLARQSFAGMQLDGAVITNVRRAHLDLHGSVLAYRKIKRRILDYLKPGGYVIVNMDDPASRFVLGALDHPVLTFGQRQAAEVTATVLERFPGEQTFLLQAGSEAVPVRTRMIGDFHISNCLAAAAVGLVSGLDLTTIARGLEAVDDLPGRMERIVCGQPFPVIVDGAATADALAATLKSLRPVVNGRLICVYGAAGAGDAAERPLLGRTAERYADVGIVTRSNPGHEDVAEIAHQILDGYERPARAHYIPDRARAIGWALHHARPEDAVLIAGRGNQLTEKVSDQELEFDDRSVARYFLQEMAPTAGSLARHAA